MAARIVIATHNAHKAGEMVDILRPLLPTVKFLNLTEFEGAIEPEESGKTYSDNALIKASKAASFTGEYCLADDAGLEIDFLEGAPGVFSKRFGGESLPFAEKIDLVLESMKDAPKEGRTARFRCAVALSDSDGDAEIFEATLEGEIAMEPRGTGGFGYDSIFLVPSLGKTLGELTPAEKHAISHRGKVLQIVAKRLRDFTFAGMT